MINSLNTKQIANDQLQSLTKGSQNKTEKEQHIPQHDYYQNTKQEEVDGEQKLDSFGSIIKNPQKNVHIIVFLFIVIVSFFLLGINIGFQISARPNKSDRFFKKTIYNQHMIGKVLGKDEKYQINLTQMIPDIKHIYKSVRPQDNKNPNDTIYVLTPHDLKKLIEKIDFQKMKQQILNQIPYELLEFQERQINITKPLMKYEHFKNDSQIEAYLKNLKNVNEKNQAPEDELYQLALQQIKNPDKKQILEAQYYSVNKRYNISQKDTQIPMCIIGAQYKLYPRDQYKKFFQSVERLNYTNFHIIYIDDYSPDDTAYKVYDYVRNSNFKFKSKIKIVHTLQSVSGLANIVFWSQKLCNEDQIVVNIDLDDSFVGAQVLKILNVLYQKQENWYVYSRYLQQKYGSIKIGFSSNQFRMNTTLYRRSWVFITSHLKTYRVKLMKSAPLYHFIEYHYNLTSGIGWPTFPTLTTDRPQVYTLTEMAGSDRIKHFRDFSYIYYGSALSTRNCYPLHEQLDAVKWFLRTPLKRLNYLGQKAQQIQNDTIPEDIFNKTIKLSQELHEKKCYKV